LHISHKVNDLSTEQLLEFKEIIRNLVKPPLVLVKR